jgi:fumarate reductase subunit C
MSNKPLVRDLPPTSWYFSHPRYLRYMAREITCIFVGAYSLYLVCMLARLSEGRDAYATFLRAMTSPMAVILSVLVLIAAVYHAVTWIGAMEKAIKIQIGEEFVDGSVITRGFLAVWLVLSLVILFLAGVF